MGDGRISFFDKEEREYEVDPDQIRKIAWVDDSGTEVEAHGLRGVKRDEGEDESPETEAHSPRARFGRGNEAGITFSDEQGNDQEIDPSQITKVAWVEDSGEEREVEAHGLRGLK